MKGDESGAMVAAVRSRWPLVERRWLPCTPPPRTPGQPRTLTAALLLSTHLPHF